MFIQIEKNQDGSHAFQCGGFQEEGWAVIPANMDLPDTFPYVDIEVAVVHHEATAVSKEFDVVEVIAMTPSEPIEVEIVEYPTQLDRVEAQVAYTAMMTGTLLEE